MTEDALFQRARRWSKKNDYQINKINEYMLSELANGNKTYSDGETYAVLSKSDDPDSQGFSYTTFIIFCLDNCIVTGEELVEKLTVF